MSIEFPSSESTEKQMREADVPTPHTVEDLASYVKALVEREHDYGTCVYAMSMAAVAAFNFAAHSLGVTGFQASCADMDVLRRTRRMRGPFMLVDGANALYPQYDLHEKLSEFLAGIRPWLATEAVGELEKFPTEGSERVRKHLEALADEAKP